MGILNVTPDSFSDGGRYFGAERAIEHGLALRAQGADILDIGGESTRPGAERISAQEEQDRVLPVISALRKEGIAVSIDTLNAATALSAAAAGATIINDVSGGLADPDILHTVAGTELTYILGHWRNGSTQMDARANYGDVVADVRSELQARVRAAKEAGISDAQLVLDPGLGFSKIGTQNWQLLRRQSEFAQLGYRVMIGASRKRFLGDLLADGADVEERDLPTAIVSVLSAQQGAWAVRVHNVEQTRAALDTVAAWNS
nr:dihydropteroate synthase [Lysinibacter cavernae]